MKYIVISFKSRNNVQLFAKIIRNHFIPSEIISTPRSISISCGLSIKTHYSNFPDIMKLLQNSNFNDCLGIYLVEKFGFKEESKRLY